ncbi:MAG: 5,10-methylenetetrahydromethanopterin reductase [Glaciecola sp.]|jgi:5,10-methylenetetrahydromethanopterin reductase
MTDMRVGLGISEDLPIAVQQDVAREAEAAGLSSIWTNEARGRDALLVCQAWAAATTTLEVGVAVLPIWTRSPAQIAMGAATLQEASGGRFHLGLGVSHPGTMGPWHHANFRKPLTAAREHLEVLDQLFRGESSNVAGAVTGSRHFRLGLTPLPPPPAVHLGAMGPRMLDLAADKATGAFLNWSGPTEVARAVAAMGQVRKDATSTTYVRIAVDPDVAAARESLATEFGRYAALPAYAAHFERQGLAGAVAALKAAHKGGRTPGSAVNDDQLAIVGWWESPADDPGAALHEYRNGALDHLVARVVVVGSDAATSIRHVITAVASASIRPSA